MMLLGTLFPKFFASIAGALTVALLLVIVVELVEVFILGIHHGVIDWIVVLIFCGYVGVDWGRANQIPKCIMRQKTEAIRAIGQAPIMKAIRVIKAPINVVAEKKRTP